MLRSCRSVYVDATFRVVPSLFYLLFTVFVQHTADHSSPVMYALMTRKATALYQVVFEMLHELLPDFQPNQVIADFEEAPATAIRAVFGDAVTVSAVFNYLCLSACTAIMLPFLNDILQYSFLCDSNSVKYYMCSTPFGFPYMRFPAFTSPVVWCRVFRSDVFRPCIFDRPAFSSLAFSVPPVVLQKAYVLGALNCRSNNYCVLMYTH